MNRHGVSRAPRQGGLSLVEVMVALLLGSIITAGVIQMFTANRMTYQMNTGQARLQENARFAIDVITDSLRMAAYRGCSDNAPNRSVIDGPAALVDQFDMSDPIAGHTGGASGWTPALDALPGDIPTADIAPETDVLVIRTVLDEGLAFLAAAPADPDESLVALPVGCADGAACDGFGPGDVVMASDCLRTAVFVLNGAGSNGQTGAGQMRIFHAAGAGGADGLSNTQNPIELLGRRFGDDARLFRVGSEVFYVAPGTRTNNVGDVPMSLYRKRGVAAPVELVEGVVGLTLLYGEDTDDDRIPNHYRSIDQVADRQDIMTIRVTMSVTSVDAVSDGDVLQRDFDFAVAIRNRN